MDKTRFWPVFGAFSLIFAALAAPGQAYGDVDRAQLRAFCEGEPVGECPLEHTDVQVDISGFIARVTLTQRYANPYETPIEAVYAFPMSEKGAVDRMTMKVGDRFIKGVIKERTEANRIYQEAKSQGKAASLLDQERPNIFTQRVANIMPGDAIEITLSYVEYLEYKDGEYAFAFPMVVGPRYIPGGGSKTAVLEDRHESSVRPTPQQHSGAQVPDADRITPPVTPEGTRAGHDIALSVHLDAGVPVRDVRSELHEVDIWRRSESVSDLRLKNMASIPNRDFVLRYAVGGNQVDDAILAHNAGDDGFFTLILQPPARVAPENVTPKEMIFIIDCSGSMSGFPLDKAREAMTAAITNMNPHDTFNLISFSGGLGYCFPAPVSNTDQNQRKALDYLDKLRGGGGTEMMPAIRAALANQNDRERLRIVCFMTDGFIGNDMAILDAIQKHSGSARVFAFGIGNGVNRFLIEGMARAGRGASEIVTLESEGAEAASRFHERIHSPVLTDIDVDFGDLDVEEVFPDPKAMPDLFASQPLILKGRYAKAGDGVVTIRGNTANGPYERAVMVTLPKRAEEHDVLAPLWARTKIASIMETDWLGAQHGQPRPDVKAAVTTLGLNYNLVTQYTSFVAVENKVINESGQVRTIETPVEMTDGVSYEGVFGVGNSLALSKAAPSTPRPMAEFFEAPAQAGARFESLGYLGDPNASPRTRGRAMADRSVATAVAEEPVDERRELKAGESDDRDGRPNLGRRIDLVAYKLHESLHDLATKVASNNVDETKVTIVNGMVQVTIQLKSNEDELLNALRSLGVQIKSHRRSGKTVMALAPVADLNRVAQLDGVIRIEPVRF